MLEPTAVEESTKNTRRIHHAYRFPSEKLFQIVGLRNGRFVLSNYFNLFIELERIIINFLIKSIIDCAQQRRQRDIHGWLRLGWTLQVLVFRQNRRCRESTRMGTRVSRRVALAHRVGIRPAVRSHLLDEPLAFSSQPTTHVRHRLRDTTLFTFTGRDYFRFRIEINFFF